MGESGIGKSTLLNLIAGLDRPDAGDQARRRDLAALDDDALTRSGARMGFVFQAFHILPYLSVAQNVALPLVLQPRRGGRRRAARRARCSRPSAWTGARRACRANCPAANCSASPSRARWCTGRSLLLADEPTGNLDPDSAAQVLALLREQVKEQERGRHPGHAFAGGGGDGRPHRAC